jgi:hypothetical protein
MRTKVLLFAVAVLTASGLAYAVHARQAASGARVIVYKSPTCGCCSLWVQHLRTAGFQVEAHDVSDAKLAVVAAEGGVRDDLRSCHTAKVDGYTVEGHVPAADIQKMLKERPKISGIAVPGMPLGSPGMEQGGQKQPYATVAFTKGGTTSVYARH